LSVVIRPKAARADQASHPDKALLALQPARGTDWPTLTLLQLSAFSVRLQIFRCAAVFRLRSFCSSLELRCQMSRAHLSSERRSSTAVILAMKLSRPLPHPLDCARLEPKGSARGLGFRRRSAVYCTACVDHGSRRSLAYVWSAGRPMSHYQLGNECTYAAHQLIRRQTGSRLVRECPRSPSVDLPVGHVAGTYGLLSRPVPGKPVTELMARCSSEAR